MRVVLSFSTRSLSTDLVRAGDDDARRMDVVRADPESELDRILELQRDARHLGRGKGAAGKNNTAWK